MLVDWVCWFDYKVGIVFDVDCVGVLWYDWYVFGVVVIGGVGGYWVVGDWLFWFGCVDVGSCCVGVGCCIYVC